MYQHGFFTVFPGPQQLRFSVAKSAAAATESSLTDRSAGKESYVGNGRVIRINPKRYTTEYRAIYIYIYIFICGPTCTGIQIGRASCRERV